jgi:integrase
MSNLTAAQLLAQLRQNAAPILTTATRTNTKSPISEPDQKTIRAYIEQHEPAWLLTFYDVSLETGWRTNDCVSLRYDAIDWDAGTVTITVAKQTKAAQARALAKGLKEIREARQAAALSAGDAVAYMQWGAATRDELAAAACPAELDRLAYLVASAPRKVDTKRLSADLLARLKGMEAAAFWGDGYVFSRALSASNSSRLQSGAPITRQTVWARLRAVFDAVAEVVENAAKLSAYSLRKSFAVALYHAAGRSVAAVMRAMGHSSEAMSLRYMGLDDEAARVQAAMVRGAA